MAVTPRDRQTDSAGKAWASLRVVADPAVLIEAWRGLEAEGLVTPYQSHGWISAYCATIGAAEAMEFRFVQVSDAEGRALALLPLVLTRGGGCRFAGFIGGKHANYHMGVFRRDYALALEKKAAGSLLREAAAAIGGLDAFVFVNQPLEWSGVPNPLASLAAGASPSPAYKLAIEAGDGEASLKRAMSSHARKKLKHKRGRFEALGAWRFERASQTAEVDAVLDVFLAQKAERFRRMRVPDPFAAPAVRAFLREGALAPAPAPLELYGLERDGRIVGTYVGAVQGTRFSGMATSFDMDDESVRHSPGEILLSELIARKAREGVAVFDLGVGEARYKTTFCDGRDELVDTFLPLTPKGRMVVSLAQAKRAAARRIKASPIALKLVQRGAALLRRPRPGTDD